MITGNKLKILLLILLSLPQIILPQEEKKEVKTYIDYLKDYKYDVFKPDTSSIQSLKHAAKLMHEASETDAIATSKRFFENCKLYDSLSSVKRHSNQNIPIFTKPAGSRAYILYSIKTRLPKTIYPIVVNDYLLKVTIKSVETVIHHLKGTPPSKGMVPRIDVTATVEDIVKGENRFRKGDMLKFYYFSDWERGESKDLKNDGTYFIPLNVNPGADDKYDWLAYNMVEGDTNKPYELQCGLLDGDGNRTYDYFPVTDHKLTDKYNFWGYGDNLSWKDFKAKLIEQIKIIKTW